LETQTAVVITPGLGGALHDVECFIEKPSIVARDVVIGLIDFYRLRPKSVAVQVNK
jgi:hypothetical protein